MARHTITREFFIPQNPSLVIEDEEAKAVVYFTTDIKGRPSAMAFGGRRQRPDFNYNFRDDQHRQEYVEKYLEDQREAARRKRKRQGFVTTLKEGDILYTSWGYEQTNIDWYQVIEVKPSGKTVVIREICGEYKQGEGTATYSGWTTPLKDQFKKDSESLTKRVRQGNVLTMTSYSSAFPWDGKRKYWSAYH
jgi:hypothetical protein